MSQIHQQASLPKCPSCEEPLEPGDLFCGACGYDLSAVPERPGDRPTIAITTPPPPPPSAPLPPPAPAVAPPAAVRHDDRAAPGQAAAPGSGSGPASGSGSGSDSGSASGSGSATASGDFELAAPGEAQGGVPGAAPGSVPREAPGGVPVGAPAPDPRTPGAAGSGGTATKLCVACRAGRVDTDGYCEVCGHAQPRERDHMEQELGAVAAVSDRGLRHHRNEDSFAVSATALPDGSPAVVAIVCDGVSSAHRPDEASAAAAHAAGESLLESLPRGTHPQQAMHDAIVAASLAVNALAGDREGATEPDSQRHQNAPACTLVGAVVAAGLLVVGWVGDSRVYWVPSDRTQQPARLTEDDSWAAQMVAAGLMSEEQAYADERAHAITGWLGADAYELDPHTASFKPDRPGTVVVCTDGLWNYAESAEEMAAAVPPDAYQRPLHGAQVLVGHALDGGGHDNVTVALLPFAVEPAGAHSA